MRKLIVMIGICTCMVNSNAIDLTGLLNSHDPATLIKDGDIYYHFTTGNYIWYSYSTNLTHWIGGPGTVFGGTIPSWIKTYVPDFGGHFWAPDVVYMNNAYYIYYSCSTFGSSMSAIGVAKSASLNSPNWTDLGMVVFSSGLSTDINAIDPGIFRDTDGKAYMVYGSWFGGIGMVEIDTVTGKATTSTTHLYGGGHQSIEAAYLFKEEDYYYLVVNRGNCCQGTSSTYYITVGRSDDVYGTYEGWDTLLAKSGKYIGPGHFGLLREDCHNYVSIHYYDGDDGGAAKLDILKMTMEDEWPVLTRDFEFDEDCPTGIFNFSARDDREVEIYPNPALNGRFSMDIAPFLCQDDIDVSIYNLDGRLLFNRFYPNAQTLEVETGLGQGIYMVRVTRGTETYFKKLSVY